ncbi:hypothetical protein KIN20_035749 [Parelaphostrongylus tenuis]|uniref:Uncharacterized protein n=1 Tax=Parelaphostrongylus tenuis TaxID=148309 RepID=A0AAD5WK68_PARTN|nr:hypothetical protein KIN20_035749 [Parelaphostrongylus tenuis]
MVDAFGMYYFDATLRDGCAVKKNCGQPNIEGDPHGPDVRNLLQITGWISISIAVQS